MQGCSFDDVLNLYTVGALMHLQSRASVRSLDALAEHQHLAEEHCVGALRCMNWSKLLRIPKPGTIRVNRKKEAVE